MRRRQSGPCLLRDPNCRQQPVRWRGRSGRQVQPVIADYLTTRPHRQVDLTSSSSRRPGLRRDHTPIATYIGTVSGRRAVGKLAVVQRQPGHEFTSQGLHDHRAVLADSHQPRRTAEHREILCSLDGHTSVGPHPYT